MYSLIPSSEPSNSPSTSDPSWCQDNTDIFPVTLSSGNIRQRNCAWATENKEHRCAMEGVSDECPVTCDTCLCQNNPGSFSTKTIFRTCDWVQSKLVRCLTSPAAYRNCPGICGRCPTNAPSSAPSVPPSVMRSPVSVSTKIQLQMSTTSADVMSFDNKKLLQDTLDALLSQLDTTPTFNNIKTTIDNEIVRKIARRLLVRSQLQSGDKYMIFFDLTATGEFTPIGQSGTQGSITTEEDAQFDMKLQNYFQNPKNSEDLITALTNNTSPSAEFFRNVDIIMYTSSRPDEIGTPVEKDQSSFWEFWKDSTKLIIVASASGGLLLIVLLSMFIYSRNRR